MLSLDNFQKNLQKLVNDFNEKTFLVATSGGVDSMVLLNLFRVSGFEFQVAHVNYHFREEDSDLDQKLVENFCENHTIKFHLKDISDEEKLKMKSLQNWARDVRYQFFFEILKKENLDFIVTAHHLNDNLETFIINLSRGSGIRGLSGIPENDNQVLRPLLPFSKNEISDFAKENKIDFREDQSNQKNDYLRNKIRNEIVPKLVETNDHFLENFQKSQEYLIQTKNFVEEKVNEIFNEISDEKEGNLIINKTQLSKKSPIIKFEILRKYGFFDAFEIEKIVNAKTGSFFYSDDFQLLVNREELIVSRKSEVGRRKLEEEIIILEEIENVNENLKLNLSVYIKNEIPDSEFSWKFDVKKLIFPLKLRPKKEGDTFSPIGMIGKKKVSKFFRDEKLSILAKQKTWILCDGNDEILGIIPFRQDKKFAANDETESVLIIEYKTKL